VGVPRLRFAERANAMGLGHPGRALPDDHRVRLVWSFVEGLDLTALLATIKAVDGRPGHPPADPRILLALRLYATMEGIGSAREVARLCDEHIAFERLCGEVGMNAKTMADFLVDHGAVLECLLVDSFTALVRAGVASLDRVAQDGVRVRASAGAASFRGIRPCTSAGARQKRRCTICARNLIPIRTPPAASKPRRVGGRPPNSRNRRATKPSARPGRRRRTRLRMRREKPGNQRPKSRARRSRAPPRPMRRRGS
jgi:transposase